MRTIDINCDMGEGMANDASLMPFISSANIACGYHTGNPETIRQTMALCLQHNVAIGAHPSFDDRKNFGRSNMHISDAALHGLVVQQLELFTAIAGEAGAIVNHVKPHGALYNMASKDPRMAAVIANAVFSFNKRLVLYGLAGSCLIAEAYRIGLKTAAEAFADRSYEPDGRLTPRSEAHALHSQKDAVVKQVLQIAGEQKVTAANGDILPLTAATVCIHGDGPHAVEFAQAVHEALAFNNIRIKALR